MIKLNEVVLTGLLWDNEFNQNKINQTIQHTLSGSVVVYSGKKLNGYPISLSSGENYGWLKRSVVEQISALTEDINLVMTLNIRGVNKQVMFDNSKGDGFEATPLFPLVNPTADAYYRVKINLISI